MKDSAIRLFMCTSWLIGCGCVTSSLFGDVNDLSEEVAGARWQEGPISKEQTLLISLADMGLNRSQHLYDVIEPSIYNTGLTLGINEPGSYLAAFNRQQPRAKNLAKYGYASLHASSLITERFGLARQQAVHLQEVSVHGTSLYTGCPTKTQHRLDPCPPLSVYYRTADGSCNNPQNRFLGAAMTSFSRFLPADYSDGVQKERRSVDRERQLPSAREVSVTLHRDVNLTSTRVTMMVMQWGQFLDHDITSSAQSRGFNGSVPRCCSRGKPLSQHSRHPDCMPIDIPQYDPFYSRYNQTCMEFVRSSPAPRPDCTLGPRDQINQITSFIDASNVYGSTLQETHDLRLFNDGMLKYTPLRYRKPLLPSGGTHANSECRMTNENLHCFAAGDDRVNEQPGLTSMHTLWLREHNRLAAELSALNEHWSDERVFQETRRVVGAMLQVITYNEWLPVVLGRSVIDIFGVNLQRFGFFYGYNSTVNPSVANAFATAAFRFGHSLVNGRISRCDKFGNHMNLDISLHQELMNPAQLHNMGSVDRLMFGMLYQPAQRRDVFISRELTNRLFQTTEPFGMDLASINIQRGRDHGLSGYVRWREECGLKAFNNWGEMLEVMDDDSVARLRISYRHLADIDLFAGGLAERPVKGGLVGPTFACIIGQQFINLKVGDRFWFENGGMRSSFTPSQLHQLRKTTLARVLCDNLDDIDMVRPLVMRTGVVSDRNRPVACQLIRNVNLRPWKEEESADRDAESPSQFQFTPKHRPHSSIASSLLDIIAFRMPNPLNNQRPSPQYLREDELQHTSEPSQQYLEELPGPLSNNAGPHRPLYSFKQLAQILAAREPLETP